MIGHKVHRPKGHDIINKMLKEKGLTHLKSRGSFGSLTMISVHTKSRTETFLLYNHVLEVVE